MVFGFPIIVVLVVASVAIIIAFLLERRTRNKVSSLESKSNGLKGTSVKMNILWLVLLLPLTLFSFLFAVATLMSAAAGDSTHFQQMIFSISAFLFMAFPVIVMISVILSLIFRKKERFTLSIRVQFVPLGAVLLAFLLLFTGSVL